jgi:hypothetical protein
MTFKVSLKAAIFCSAFAMASSSAFAEEYMEVAAPNECCQAPLPAGLGLLMGMAGTPSASAAGGGLRAVALKAAVNRAAEQRSQEQQEQQSQEQKETQYNDAVQNKDSAKQTNVWDFLSNLTNKLLDGGQLDYEKSTTKNEDGTITETETRNCKAGGPLNPNNVPCTYHKFEYFTDPTDGSQKWAYTMSVIEPKYNPKHYDADASGHYPSVIGNQTFTIVFETKEDLMWQLRRIGGH